MRSQVVTQYLHAVVEVKGQYGILGVSLKKPQEVNHFLPFKDPQITEVKAFHDGSFDFP